MLRISVHLVLAAAEGLLNGTKRGREKIILATHSNGGLSAALMLSGYRSLDSSFNDIQFSTEDKFEVSKHIQSFVAIGFSDDISAAAHLLTARLKKGPTNTGLITGVLPKLFQYTVMPNSFLYRKASSVYIKLLDLIFPADVRWREHISEPGALEEFLSMLKSFNLPLSARRTTDTLRAIDEYIMGKWKNEKVLVPTTYIQAGWDVAISEYSLKQLVDVQKSNKDNSRITSIKLAGTDHVTMLLSSKVTPLLARVIHNPNEYENYGESPTVLDWRDTKSLAPNKIGNSCLKNF